MRDKPEDLSIPGKRTTFKCFLGCIKLSQIFSWETYVKLKKGIILCPEPKEGVMVWTVDHRRQQLKARGCRVDRPWGKGVRLPPPVMSDITTSHSNKCNKKGISPVQYSQKSITLYSFIYRPWEKHQIHQSWRTFYKIAVLTRSWKRRKDRETVQAGWQLHAMGYPEGESWERKETFLEKPVKYR